MSLQEERYLLPRGFARIQFAKRDNKGAAKLAVPAPLARMIGPERIFKVELTEDGILYRYVEGGEPVPSLPEWLQ